MPTVPTTAMPGPVRVNVTCRVAVGRSNRSGRLGDGQLGPVSSDTVDTERLPGRPRRTRTTKHRLVQGSDHPTPGTGRTTPPDQHRRHSRRGRRSFLRGRDSPGVTGQGDAPGVALAEVSAAGDQPRFNEAPAMVSWTPAPRRSVASSPAVEGGSRTAATGAVEGTALSRCGAWSGSRSTRMCPVPFRVVSGRPSGR